MSRMLKPALAGLAISSLCLAFAADLRAQNAGSQAPAKKKSPIKQAQAIDDAPVDSATKGKTQAPSAAGKSTQLARPEVKPLEVQKPDPELEKVLKDWEKNTSLFKRIVGDFEVIKYDQTFEVGKRGVGKFAHEAPDKGSYEKEGAVISKGQKAAKKNNQGIPYKLESDDSERWVCNGKEIMKINVKEKTYERMPIPPAAQGENMIEGPLPFFVRDEGGPSEKAIQIEACQAG